MQPTLLGNTAPTPRHGARSKYLLASNNFGYANKELKRKRYRSSRHLDITAAPFRYPPPIWHDHYLGLWQLADMEPGPGAIAA